MKADQIGPQLNELMKSLIQSIIDVHKIFNSLLTKKFLKGNVCSVNKNVWFLGKIQTETQTKILFKEIDIYKEN